MASEVTMPKMGYDMEEGTILAWTKSEGEAVAKGDVLGEIETGKVNIEIEAFDAGVLLKIVVPEGETVPVGTAIAYIGEEGEEIDLPADGAAPAAAKNGAATGAGGAGEADADSSEAASAASEAADAPADEDGERLRASPLARRIASEEGVDLAAVEGSGPHGRIVRDDVMRALEEGAASTSAPAEAPAEAAPTPAPAAGEREELSRMRQVIAQRLRQSWQEAPHIFLTMAIDMGEALALRKQVNAHLAETEGGKVSVNDLVVKAAAVALRRHPLMNVSWDEGGRVRHEGVHVGVAVALDDGLMTVVARDADAKPISALGAEIADKAERARAGRLTPADMDVASTFTVSNLGMYGIEEFTAILNPPEAGILAVGAAVPTPVVRDGEVVVRPIMRVTLSADHRVVDGATAAAYLVTLRELLEQPLGMLV